MVPAFELRLERVWINPRDECADPSMPPSDLTGLSACVDPRASAKRQGGS